MGLFDSILRQTENLIKNSANQAVKGTPGGANPAPASGAISKTVTRSALPQNVAEMQAMPEFTLSDPFTVLAFGVAALNRYATDREASKEMLNALKGPEPLTVRELQFINDRFMDGKNYITRSYFGGTSPENDYTPSVPYTVKITEQSNSRENEGYIKLYLTSSGADSIRPVTLRSKTLRSLNLTKELEYG